MIVVAGAKYVTDANSSNCTDSFGHYCEYLDFWVARFTSSGAPDSSFGVGGEMTTNVDSRGNDDQGRAVVIQIMASSSWRDIRIRAASPSPTMGRMKPSIEPTTSPWRATRATDAGHHTRHRWQGDHSTLPAAPTMKAAPPSCRPTDKLVVAAPATTPANATSHSLAIQVAAIRRNVRIWRQH